MSGRSRAGLLAWTCAIVVALAALAVPATSTAAGDGERRALPGAQERIAALVEEIATADGKGGGERLRAASDELRRFLGDDRGALLRQLTLFRAGNPGNEPAMATALLIGHYDFSPSEKVEALVPWLDVDDRLLLATIADILSTVDRAGRATPDFGPYETLLRSSDPPAGLVRYLYAVSPLEALRAVARAHAVDLPAATLRSAEMLADLGNSPDDETLSRARAGLDALSRDASWWVRRYAAEALRRHPGLASREIEERLRSDRHPLVRDALAPHG